MTYFFWHSDRKQKTCIPWTNGRMGISKGR